MTTHKPTPPERSPLLPKPTTKVVGLSVLACAVGLTVFGLLRYNAKASELLPNISTAKAVFSQTPQTHERLHFSMEKAGPQSGYRLYEVEVIHNSGEARVRLRVQKADKDAVVKEHEQTVPEKRFTQFWQALRQLETAQLTNLSPSTENWDQKTGAVKRLPLSETYRFKFQDGLQDYPNSFEVYAPEALEDDRYQALTALTHQFVEDTFGDSISE